MRHHVLILVAGCVPLGGCGYSLFDNSPQFAARAVDSGIIDSESESSVALAKAREAMRAGNIMAAMSAYRIAQRDPNAAAEATNGRGVAWATLGRHDIAERMFIEAVALAPNDRRFTANLERLYAGKATAGAAADAQLAARAQSLVQPMPTSTLRSGTVSASGTGDQLVRINNREVVIGAATPARSAPMPMPTTAPKRVSLAPAPTTVASGGSEPIRVALPRTAERPSVMRVSAVGTSSAVTVLRRSSTPSYAIRVASKPASVGYPLRAQLRSGDGGGD